MKVFKFLLSLILIISAYSLSAMLDDQFQDMAVEWGSWKTLENSVSDPGNLMEALKEQGYFKKEALGFLEMEEIGDLSD